ncbi:MAG: hypothetical protein R3D86_08470 [Emcibacteraceae bacterium]
MGSRISDAKELFNSDTSAANQRQIISDFDGKLIYGHDKNIPETLSLEEYQALIEKIYFK